MKYSRYLMIVYEVNIYCLLTIYSPLETYAGYISYIMSRSISMAHSDHHRW